MTDAAPAPPADEPVRPIPPRFWWLKRILLAVGVLIVSLLILRWWWGCEAERRLQAKIAEYRAAGQPVTIEDFQFPPVPDEENAAHFLTQAAGALTRPPAADAFVEDLYSYPDGVAEHADAVGRWVAANAEVLRLVRVARSTHEVDWQLRFKSPVIAAMLPQLSPQRNLAKFACVTVLYRHHTGDDAAAVETLRDAFAQGETIGRMRGVLIGHLVAIAIDALAANAVEGTSPTLEIHAGGDPQGATTGAATPQQVRALIADLLDEEPLRESWRWAMYGERMSALDYINLAMTIPGGLVAMGSGAPLPPGPIARFLRPMFELDAIFMMEYCTAYAEAATAENFTAAMRHAARYPAFGSGIERSTHALSSIVLPSLEGVVNQLFQVIAMRRMAATALAIRLYEVDHGRRPATLDELVPEYLSAVPGDPFASDARGIGYLPNNSKPVLYSIGPDGTDDGGEYELGNAGGIVWRAKDLVFFLNGDRPRAPWRRLATQPNATEAVDDGGDEVGDGGQPEQDQPADEQ